jgi:hypothetical protein
VVVAVVSGMISISVNIINIKIFFI